MDPFAVAMLGLLVGLILLIVLAGEALAGLGARRAGAEELSEILERHEALEAEDVRQLLAARNARRRARGEREVTLEEMELQVFNEIGAESRRREQHLIERREQQLADRDLDELLEATNAEARAGLPERTREQARREFSRGAGTESEPPAGE